ncbi:AraC family transcriptional regulator [Leucobacter zeae]|nr:AraC family transcriptional regulator [Leucobacter zeae]
MHTLDPALRLRTNDAAEVERLWQLFVPSSQLLHVDPQRCGLDWFSSSLPGFSLVRYEMRADVRSSVEPEDQLFSCRVTTTTGGSENDGGALAGDRPWVSDGAPIRAQWRDTALVEALAFDRCRAQHLARQISGDDSLRVRVRGAEAISAEAAQHWARTFRYLAASLSALPEQEEARSLVATSLERLALWTVLSTFSTTFSDSVRRPVQTRAAPQTVRRALAYIDEHAHEPITVDDVARAAHISTRGLQYAFRRSVEFSPSDYLRRARLSGAREDLLRASEAAPLSAEAVERIAARWNFTNAARFANIYREEYREDPGALRV